MKKHLNLTALFLAALMSLSIPVFAASSTPTFTAEAGKNSVDVGDKVELTVSVSNNPGISCVVFDVDYDTDLFTCAEADVEMEKALTSNGFTMVVNPDNDGKLRIVAAAVEDCDENGALFTVTFRAIASGTFALEFEDIVSGEKLIDARTEDDTVTVKGDTRPAEDKDDKKEPSTHTVSFSDVPESHWAHSYIQNVVRMGLFTGISNTQFGPDMSVTRGMFVTVLYGHAGAPSVPAATFSDVPATTWYAKSVSWASEKGLANGIGDNKFGPELPITREQLAVILYQYAKGTSPGTEAFVRMFYPDGKDISSWALTAMSWAINEGLISGKTGNLLAPQATATRAEVAVIMQNFIERSNA